MSYPAEKQIIQFDSSTSMFKALSAFLHGKDFAGVGVLNPSLWWTGDLVNALPAWLRREIYCYGGWRDALPSREVGNIQGEAVSQWTTSFYPDRTYDALMIGSSNGAAIHLGAALGIPWLPQTFLVAARRKLEADQILEDIEWGRKTIQPFLEANPDFEVHQMHDPLQDRLMVSRMGYFRLKKRLLGKAYEDFIRRNVKKSGRLITIECRNFWPKYKVQDRHNFQLGGFGGLNPEEYYQEGAKLRDFANKTGAKIEKWREFEPNEVDVEAEWGFADDLLEDIRCFSKKEGYGHERIVFKDPEALSPLVADFYREWYEKRQLSSERLLIENFALLEPYWALKTGLVPLWLVFNTDCSHQLASEYVDKGGPFKEIYLMLMSNGVSGGIGLTPISYWQELLSRAKSKRGLIGVNPDKYPLDIGNFIKFHADLQNKIKTREEMPEPVSWEDFEAFMTKNGKRYEVEIIRG